MVQEEYRKLSSPAGEAPAATLSPARVPPSLLLSLPHLQPNFLQLKAPANPLATAVLLTKQ